MTNHKMTMTRQDTMVRYRILEISRLISETALSISDDSDFQIHLKRPPDLYFANNYFQDELFAWEANLDIQHVFNQTFQKLNLFR